MSYKLLNISSRFIWHRIGFANDGWLLIYEQEFFPSIHDCFKSGLEEETGKFTATAKVPSCIKDLIGIVLCLQL
jgi:hypothetical protein